jgi:hypothetical protein
MLLSSRKGQQCLTFQVAGPHHGRYHHWPFPHVKCNFYNPRNQRYYKPNSYKFDPYRIPSSINPTIKYDGGRFVSLNHDDNPAISKPYPPGT